MCILRTGYVVKPPIRFPNTDICTYHSTQTHKGAHSSDHDSPCLPPAAREKIVLASEFWGTGTPFGGADTSPAPRCSKVPVDLHHGLMLVSAKR